MWKLPFRNRVEAGRALAKALQRYADRSDVVVLGLPRGGVVVAFEVAQALHVHLDVMVVCKLGVPGQEELALGAVAAGGVRILDQQLIEGLGIASETIERLTARRRTEVDQRESLYRGECPRADVSGKVAILVDDGIATGSTARAAILALRQSHPARVIMATPVAPAAAYGELSKEADEVVCLAQPELFFAVGQFYWDFSQTSDEQVRELLHRAATAGAIHAA